MKYSNIATRIFNTPLLLDASKANVISAVVLDRIQGHVMHHHQEADEPPRVVYAGISSTLGPGSQPAPTGRIAVISIEGSLVHRSTIMNSASGLRSYSEISEDIEAAVADSSIKGILLRVDSPGGEVNGAYDTADLIHQAAKKKPIWAIAEDSALSAGYMLASQANKVYMTQSALVGSIGVIMMHADLSQAEEKAGVQVTTLYRGARKADMSSHTALSKEAREVAEGLLDAHYGRFLAVVARGRGLSTQTVRATEAAIYTDARAVQLGLADGVGSYRDVLSRFASSLVAGTAGTRTAQAAAQTAVLTAKQRAQFRHEALTYAQSVVSVCEFAGRLALASRFLLEDKPLSEIAKTLRGLDAAEKAMPSYKN